MNGKIENLHKSLIIYERRVLMEIFFHILISPIAREREQIAEIVWK